MSASLPRIKSLHEVENNKQSQPVLKFRKLNLDSQNGQERKGSLKSIKTERLSSLSRYTTLAEQREYKNQKIHLNLIERKLLNGTYDQKKQTGNELNILKQKRDHFKVECALKKKEAERIKKQLEETKEEMSLLLETKGEIDKKVKQAKDKYEQQLVKTQSIRQSQWVLEYVLKTRKDINLNLSRRSNSLKRYYSQLLTAVNLIDKQLREVIEKVKSRQSTLDELVRKDMKDRNQRNEIISKQQENINKRIEDEIWHSEKSKQYLADLDEEERLAERKMFYSLYNKILANEWLARFSNQRMAALHTKYEQYQYCYRKLTSYPSFDPAEPKTLVTRFFSHEDQRKEREKQIKESEQYIISLEALNDKLKEKQFHCSNELMQTEEQLALSKRTNRDQQHQNRIVQLQEESRVADEKVVKVKNHILRMMNILNKKGRRKEITHEAAVTNLQLLASLTLELAKAQN